MTQDNLEKRVEKIILRFLNNLYKAPDGEVLSQATKAILELIKEREDKWQQELMGKISDLEEELYHERQSREVKNETT